MRNITEELEALIDATSLQHVLIGLECICGEKAEHIRVNRQDKATARPWDAASKLCGKIARHVDV